MLTQADMLARAREFYPSIKDTQLTRNLASVLAARAIDFTNEEAGVVKPFLPDWYVGMECKKDRLITYQGEVYRIGQDHTATDTYHPGDEGTTALYSHILLDDEGNEIWQAFDGVSGTYRYLQVVRDPNDWLLYRSTLQGAGNVWGPPHEQPDYWELVKGQNGIESEPEDEYPPYVQPTGAHDAYHNGDKITWNEEHYICIAPEGVACVWDPGTYPSYWQKA